jgi:multiple sugar transport system substrate-binding protein
MLFARMEENTMKFRPLLLVIAAVLLLTPILAACGGAAEPAPTEPPAVEEPAAEEAAVEAEPAEEEVAEEEPAEQAAPAGERVQVSMWSHSAGNPDEISVVQQMIEDFNAKQDTYEVVLEAFPQASYNDSVAAASVAGNLPCIVDLDQPTVPNFAWSGYVQPLPVSEEELGALNILDAEVGRWNGEVYSLGQFDVALLIYARKSVLEEFGVRIPTMEEPWSWEEFQAALDTFKDSGDFEYAIDVNAGWEGEWWPYGYSPMLQSAGGDLIDRETYMTAEGVLNGPEAVEWAEWFQKLFTEGYANPTPPDDQCFLQGRCALWYTGSWSANAVLETVGDDALFLPAVDFGNGPAIGAGSWQFGVSATCEEPEGATEFIMYTMEPENVAMMSEVSSLVPATAEGAAQTEKFAEDGVFRPFYEMSEAFAIIRPPTPGYLKLSSEFERALIKIRDGENVQDALDDAVDAIDRDIEDNSGYGF